MTHVLELEPGGFDQLSTMPNDESEAIRWQFLRKLKLELGDYLVDPDFSADNIASRFHRAIDGYRANVIDDALGREKQFHSDEFRPLHRHLGALAVSAEESERLTLADEFVSGLHEGVDSRVSDFMRIGELREPLSDTDILRTAYLIQEAHQSGNPLWLQTAYGLVHAAAENPERHTVASDSLDSLFLVTMLPHPARPLMRRMIVGNVMLSQLRGEIGTEISGPEQEALSALSRFYAADALFGQQWDSHLVKDHGIRSQDLSTAMGLYSAEHLLAAGTLRRLASSSEIGSMASAWDTTGQTLFSMMKAVHFSSQLHTWQLQDIGHCFEGFGDFVLDSILQPGGDSRRPLEAGRPIKLGGKACILEDDRRQMNSIKTVVDDATPYLLDEGLCFDTPEGIDAAVDDPDIGLYLLDIQNQDDETAGIRVGERIFNAVLRRAEAGDNPHPVKLVIWSNSVEAAQAASQFFEDLVESYEGPCFIGSSWLGGRGRSKARAPLDVDIRLKRWSAITDTG